MYQDGYGDEYGLGAVSDYDIITINGKQYSVNEILDKNFIAAGSTKVYTSAFDNAKVKYISPSGTSLGKVYSYLLPTGGRSGAWLMVQTGSDTFVYVPSDSASAAAFKEQGTKTVADEIKEEQDAKEKENDPISYYIKKLGLPALLIGGGIYLVAVLGKTVIEKKL